MHDACGTDGYVRDALFREADVLLTSAPAERLAALGVDDESLRREHPGLLAVSVTPFGLDGPYARLVGDDLVLAALSGLADATPGFPDRRERFADPPLQSRAPLAEVGSGIIAAVAVLGAIVGRRRGKSETPGLSRSPASRRSPPRWCSSGASAPSEAAFAAAGLSPRISSPTAICRAATVTWSSSHSPTDTGAGSWR